MPEGHTIHRAAQDQRPSLVGEVVRASSPQGRFEAGAKALDQARLDGIDARGKHLFYRFTTRRGRGRPIVLHVHLGLAGRFRSFKVPPPPPRGAVRLRLVTSSRVLDLSGPLVCELVSDEAREAVLDRLGPDPLVPNQRASALAARLGRTKIAIGAMLLDQSVIAGVGNVYRAEILYLARIDPRRPSSSLLPDEVRQLWVIARALLRAGVEVGRIVTVDVAIPGIERPGAGAPAGRGRHRRVYAYKQPYCRRCGGLIDHVKLGGRPCYFCPRCQA